MEFDLQNYTFHHLADSHEWHLPFLHPIQLPAFLSMHQLMILMCGACLFVLFGLIYKKSTTEAPTGITNLLEALVVFIRDEISIPSLGQTDGVRMTPLFCTFFFLILGLNLLGMIPVFSTATANINVTAGLALVTLSFMIFGAIFRHGLIGFFKIFIPHGVPIAVLPILFPIEFLGLFFRAFALMIRLFANMLGGHIVVLSLVGLIVLFGWWGVPAIFLAIGISVLELFVAFLQAYVFTLLSAIFIGLTLHPEH